MGNGSMGHDAYCVVEKTETGRLDQFGMAHINRLYKYNLFI